MKKFYFAFLIFTLAIILLSACTPVVQTVEVTRVVTRIVQVNITTTPPPTRIPSPTPSATLHPTSIAGTPFILLAVTPGIQVISNDVTPDVEKFVAKQHIKDYLALQVGVQSRGGKVFCSYHPIGMGNDGQKIQLYLWILCSEYYWSDQGLRMGTGMDLPIALFVEMRPAGYEIIDFKEPGPGFELPKVDFPPEIQNFIMDDLAKSPETLQNWLKTASQEVEQEAKAYFGNQ